MAPALPSDPPTVRIFHFDEDGHGGTAASPASTSAQPRPALPRLELRTIIGERLDTDDVLGLAARAIADGLALAVKGPAGFHLVCDATSEQAVSRLRALKRDDDKPLAVMVSSIEQARTIADLGAEDEALLVAPEGPIVLARRRQPAPLAPSVAPENPLVGLVLATFPLHTALIERACRPIVVTSGNVAGAAIAGADEGVSALHGVADLFLLHDAPTGEPCDDSVARIVAGGPAVIRRARGYACPLPLARPIERPVLGCGAMLTGTFCLARGNEAVLGPHIGALENKSVYEAYVESIARWEDLLDIRPEIVAHDLSPDFPSTRYALSRDAGVRHVGVQHHHAHIAAVMAERALDGPVLGLAYDGGGRGTDGASWGSELLLVTYGGFSRIATFRALHVAGDDLVVVREPWRAALALVDDAFANDAPLDAFPLFARLTPQQIAAARAAARERGPLMHGAGRYFEGFGALLLDRPTASYCGQTAFPLNMVAEPSERGRYRYEIIRSGSPWELDLRPAVRDAVFEFVGGEPVARIAARVHNTIAAAAADLVRAASRQYGRLPVALSGGCFQNARLAESVLAALSPEFPVHLHRRVPPGDGGIALGQAVVADAIARND